MSTTCILIISIIIVIIITIICIFAFVDKDKFLIKNAKEKKKLFKAQKIVDSILDDYSKNSIIQLNSNDLIKSKYELIISRCELLKKLPPTYENYIMIYNGLLNYSKKNDNKIHKLGSILDVE